MKTCALALGALLGAAAAHAAAVDSEGSAAEAPAPQRIVTQAVDRLHGYVTATEEARPEEIRAFLQRHLEPHVDLQAMTQRAGGMLYHRLTSGQQTDLATTLEELFFDALARNLGAYARPLPEVDVAAPRTPGADTRALVRATVRPEAGYPLTLDFHFYRTPGGWKIADVAANGNSAVAYYHRYFTDLLRRYGPDVLR